MKTKSQNESTYNFDIDAMVTQAQEEAGLSDFGDWDFSTPLGILIECVERDKCLSEPGAELVKMDIHRHLVNTLRMQDDIKRHPEILDEHVSDPIVIVSMPRSGTTKTHKMLSEPDTVQKTLLWRMWNPAPFPDAVPGEPDPRIRAAGTSKMLTRDIPAADVAHRVEETEVEEEGNPYLMSFDHWLWAVMLKSPSYFDWAMSHPATPAYQYVKTAFQYLQWQDGGKRGRPWVFKSVTHLAHLDALLETYPDATIVTTHREPRNTVASFTKFITAIASPYVGELDLPTMGKEVLRQWSIAMRRYLEVRDRLQLDDRIVDVDYEQLRVDPMPIMREIYSRTDYPVTAETEQAMLDWHNNNEQGRHGKHEYSLEACGFASSDIDESFDEYIRRFIKR